MGNPGADWQIKAAADFNGDGKADILWQNDDGTPAIWLMDGTNGIGSAVLGNPGADWHIKAAADFNGDGKADILWQNDDGTPAIWLMDGTNGIGERRDRAILAPTGTSRMRRISMATARPIFSGRTTMAQPAIWLMNGTNGIGSCRPGQSRCGLADQECRGFQWRRQGRHSLAERQWHTGDVADGRHQRHRQRRPGQSRCRTGASRMRRTSAPTAKPTFSGRTTTEPLRCG